MLMFSFSSLGILTLAQGAETVGLLSLLLEGGVPLLLLAALCVVGWMYYKEKNAKTDADKACAKEVTSLQKQFTDKIESLYRERLDSETENAKIIMRATEVMDSVVNTLERTNETLDTITEDEE
jgi:hypothetical protein